MICKLCKSNLVDVFKNIDRFTLLRCLSCNFIFLKTFKPGKQVENINLSKYESIESKIFYFSKKRELETRAIKCVEILYKFKRKGKLLDVGCSYGFYTNIYSNYGFKVTGIDISKDAVNYVLKHLHLNVIRANYSKYSFNSQHFDVITMYDVIEHFENPIKIINKTNSLLNKNGIVIIQTPNIDSLIYKLTKSKWFWLLLPQHLNFFSVGCLVKLLEKSKYKILFKATWDDIEEFTNNILYILKLKDKGITMPIYYILKYVIYSIVLILNRLWNKHYLGGEILLYAQKV